LPTHILTRDANASFWKVILPARSILPLAAISIHAAGRPNKSATRSSPVWKPNGLTTTQPATSQASTISSQTAAYLVQYALCVRADESAPLGGADQRAS